MSLARTVFKLFEVLIELQILLQLVTCSSHFSIFDYNGFDTVIQVPSNCSYLYLYMWGAGGGISSHSDLGGAGAYVEGILPVKPNQSLTIVVGQGGAAGCNWYCSGSNTYGGGGPGGWGSASGGGRSAIMHFNSTQDLVTAGGGGGGVQQLVVLEELRPLMIL